MSIPRAILVGIICGLLSACSHAPNSKATTEVSVDELLKEPAKFSGQLLMVSGYWIRGFEWSFLTKDPLSESGSPIWVQAWSMPGERAVDWKAIRKAIDEAYLAAGKATNAPETRVWIRCIGWFEHRNLSSTPDNGIMQPGFGHLGHSSSQLTIERILEARVDP